MPSNLAIPEMIYDQIRAVVYDVQVETGVRIFGRIEGDRFIVEHIIGPGTHATQLPAQYECDNEYAERALRQLLKEHPKLQWLGELHVHPRNFPFLSPTDKKTAKAVITGTDDCLHPEKFVCGVMLRVVGQVAMYPVLFTKDNLEGEDMSLEIPYKEVRNVSTKSN